MNSVKFVNCSEVFEKIESTSSRNEITSILREFLSSLSSEDAEIVCYLIQGRIAPLFIPVEFSFSEKSVLKVLESITQTDPLMKGFDVKRERDLTGDIGLTTQKLLAMNPHQGGTLTMMEVYNSLWSLASTSGSGSVSSKSDQLCKLLLKMSPLEGKFVTRIVSGKMRMGISDKTVLDVFSFLAVGDKSLRDTLDYAYGVTSDLGYVSALIINNLKSADQPTDSVANSGNIKNILEGLKPIPGVPIFSRLVERVKDFEEAKERMGERFYVQPKFDGLRCQIHKGVNYSELSDNQRIWAKRYSELKGDQDGMSLFSTRKSEVLLFTRNLEEVTSMFPDVVEYAENLPAQSFIIDSEAIGYDMKTGKFVPFQETMTRKRKYGIESKTESLPVRSYAFDILYFDGNELMQQDLTERMRTLKNLLGSIEGNDEKIVFAQTDEISTVDQISEYFDRYVSEGLEGIILKRVGGSYQPGQRNYEWVKLKRSMDQNLVDTVDVVIIGYYYGSGKKAAQGMGALLGSVYNKTLDRFETVTKIGTGITDQQWGQISAKLSERVRTDKPVSVLVDDLLKPDVWVEPEIVSTVEADEITKSSVHTAGRGTLGYGLALRFPRLKVFERDKLATDCTSVDELIDMYKMRSGKEV